MNENRPYLLPQSSLGVNSANSTTIYRRVFAVAVVKSIRDNRGSEIAPNE